MFQDVPLSVNYYSACKLNWSVIHFLWKIVHIRGKWCVCIQFVPFGCSEIVKALSSVQLSLFSRSLAQGMSISCWRPSGKPFSLYIFKKRKLSSNAQTCQHCGFVMCCPVVCMCLCFASCCRLCKSWVGASRQLGGQTRKQMDLFGLNPSHATSSHWPSSSNLHVSRQSRRKGAEWECVVFGGWETVVKLLAQSREADRSQRGFAFAVLSLQTLCVLNCADIWILPPCWNSWSALCLCVSLQLFSPSGTVCCLLSQPNQHFACLSRKCLAFSGI